MVLEITDKTISDVLDSEKPVLLKIGASWCGPCKVIAPIIKEVASEMSDKTMFAEIDADASPETMTKYGIRNIPTILFFKGGEVVRKHVGDITKERLVEIINSL